MALINIETFKGKDNLVIMPACCYAGNQFEVKKYSYPPMFKADEACLVIKED